MLATQAVGLQRGAVHSSTGNLPVQAAAGGGGGHAGDGRSAALGGGLCGLGGDEGSGGGGELGCDSTNCMNLD